MDECQNYFENFEYNKTDISTYIVVCVKLQKTNHPQRGKIFLWQLPLGKGQVCGGKKKRVLSRGDSNAPCLCVLWGVVESHLLKLMGLDVWCRD